MDGESWQAMESEMDRFEAEISSLGKAPPATSPGSGSTAPATAVAPSFIPASVRKPPAPAPTPVRPKLTPVVISGGPQLYARPSSATSLRPTQISQRLIRPGLIPGSPPITPATGHGVPRLRPPLPEFAMRFPNGLPPAQNYFEQPGSSNPPSSSALPAQVLVTAVPEADKSSTSAQDPTPGTSNASKKKKKKQGGGEKKPKKHLRSAGGTIWEDQTLLDWDPKDFRLFCGDLGNDVTDEVLTRVFGRYPSFVKARVVRDKRSNKTKGYGFVSFKDPGDFVRAIRELDGRYVGSRPIKLRKSTWENRGLTQVRKRDKLQKQLLGIGPSPKPASK